jgi:type I restriction enzyme, S subunit
MEVRPGYKQTEVGVIPEEWDVVPLGNHFQFKNGLNKAKEFFGFGTPIVNYMDVFKRPCLRVEDILGCVDVNARELRAYEVRQGDVFFTRTSETVEEIGVSSVMLDEPEDTVFSGFVLRARPTDQSLDNQFKGYCFAARYFRQQVTARASYTTRALTNGRSLSAALLARPPFPEQRAIAAALSDVDALLGGLTRLIAKKRDLKQAAMQQLLTGQTRLPGFSGEWDVTRIADIASPSSEKNSLGEKLPVLTCSKHFGFMDSLGFFKNQVFSKDLSTYKVIRRDEIGYPANHIEEGSIGLQDLYDVALVSPIYVVFRVAEGISSFFMHRLLKLDSYRQKFRTATASSVDRRGSLRWPAFSEITVKLPPTEAEQTAIAAVLSDMDAELSALEARRDKTRALKQAMMQELLTGRTRLI